MNSRPRRLTGLCRVAKLNKSRIFSLTFVSIKVRIRVDYEQVMAEHTAASATKNEKYYFKEEKPVQRKEITLN